MKIGVVGSRQFPDDRVSDIARFVAGLPDGTTIVSGGAKGVDSIAEAAHKGRVWSFRPKEDPDSPGHFGVEFWDYGGKKPKITFFDPFFATYKDTCVYRDWLIAHEVDELYCFWNGYSKGTVITANFTKELGKKVEFK